MKNKKNLFIAFSIGVATATSLVSSKMFIINYFIITLPLLVLIIAYFIMNGTIMINLSKQNQL